MPSAVDVLFITHLQKPRETGAPAVYQPLRLQFHGYPASIPMLRVLAQAASPEAAFEQLPTTQAVMSAPPVFTPFYMHDYLTRRNLTFQEIPCLETGFDLVEELLRGGVGVMALSTTWLLGTDSANVVRSAVARLRALAPHVPIVVGGVGVRKGLRTRTLLEQGRLSDMSVETLANDYLLIDAKRDSVLDAILVGEDSEATLAELARRVKDGKGFKDLPNLAIPRAGEYVFGACTQEVSDVEGERVDWRLHAERVRRAEAPVRSAVGCPFQCEFCDFSGLYAARTRSMESLVAELRTLADALPAPRRVFFTDDNIAVNRRRVLELTDALIAADLGLSWRAFVRADAIDAHAADRMRESGCRECLLGIESGDPRILKNMNKRLDPERATASIRLLDERGINTQCTFMVGFPGENSASIDRTVQFISALPSGDSAGAIHRYYIFRFQVAPLCPAASPESRERFGLQGIGENWSHKTMNSEEAAAAVREVFTRVHGPSHMYLELLPPDWSPAATRSVLEIRDAIQKDRLRNVDADGFARLLASVREAESIGRKF